MDNVQPNLSRYTMGLCIYYKILNSDQGKKNTMYFAVIKKSG